MGNEWDADLAYQGNPNDGYTYLVMRNVASLPAGVTFDPGQLTVNTGATFADVMSEPLAADPARWVGAGVPPRSSLMGTDGWLAPYRYTEPLEGGELWSASGRLHGAADATDRLFQASTGTVIPCP